MAAAPPTCSRLLPTATRCSPRAYGSDALRIDMAAHGAWANIKPMFHRKRRLIFSNFVRRYCNRFFSKTQAVPRNRSQL
ncbi:hypothetical protein HNO88_004341 [Novosphingobium chloroacetimidivorans]|uniref:Uncharacterized protein n=1 Tax=Novosphingobium chloroacetimidivorans TaxID=1428314 RepID=A0A7W7KDS8_9SPHN|nr:hypothetical protein [Novosphingobium chloroacetimidivorans]MBB4860995.1 hypothetical protein [Novosphingobium chloroacetimidivorans]